MMQEQTIGGLPIQQDDPAFARGYAHGQAQFTRWHGQDTQIEAATLLFLVRNGWAGSPHTEMWQTGYIVGWLSALFERNVHEEKALRSAETSEH